MPAHVVKATGVAKFALFIVRHVAVTLRAFQHPRDDSWYPRRASPTTVEGKYPRWVIMGPYVYMYVYLFVYPYILTYTVCAYTYIQICMHVCVYIYVYMDGAYLNSR